MIIWIATGLLNLLGLSLFVFKSEQVNKTLYFIFSLYCFIFGPLGTILGLLIYFNRKELVR